MYSTLKRTDELKKEGEEKDEILLREKSKAENAAVKLKKRDADGLKRLSESFGKASKRLSESFGKASKKLSETEKKAADGLSHKTAEAVKLFAGWTSGTLRKVKKKHPEKNPPKTGQGAAFFLILILFAAGVLFVSLKGGGQGSSPAGKSEASKGSSKTSEAGSEESSATSTAGSEGSSEAASTGSSGGSSAAGSEGSSEAASAAGSESSSEAALEGSTQALEAASKEGADMEQDQEQPEGDANGVLEYDKSVRDDPSEKVPESLMSLTLRSALYSTHSFTDLLQKEVEAVLAAQYRAILDRGCGASFVPAKGQEKLWEKTRELRRQELAKDPFLLLVNKWHFLPDGYEVNPVQLENGQRISADCYESLMKMLEDCTAAGGTPIVCSGYRPHWYQVNLFNEQTSRWLYAGYGQEEAKNLAGTAVAVPGTSEHELGLAADIYSSENLNLDESQVHTFSQQWLMKNCWKYGFVLRYPEGKSEITGIIYEPWHYRYVGMEHAEKIMEAGICLEEYLDAVEHE